jgi:tripartite-type tricarboxylate transporter receptor subunit TctC
VRIVLPFAAGGVADIAARIVADKLGDKLGQRFFIENQAGAGGIAAARTVISSRPDGYRSGALGKHADIATVRESGVAGYDVVSWNALFAPAGTPPEIVKTLTPCDGIYSLMLT